MFYLLSFFIYLGFCDFENGLCAYSNSKSDDFDWLVGSGKTQSRFTGPKFDHTFGNANGKLEANFESLTTPFHSSAQIFFANVSTTSEIRLSFFESSLNYSLRGVLLTH